MVSISFGVFAILHAALTFWLVRMALRTRSRYLPLVAVVAAGLVYDNAIVALGSSIGAGSLLEALNYPRFVIHALVTPLLIIAAIGLARGAGASWARSRVVHGLFCTAASVLIVYGIIADVIGLALVAEREGDALRYAAAASTVPIPAIAVIVVLVVVGVALVRRGGAWTAIGAAIMFTVSALPSAPLAVGNMGEVALIAGLALTAKDQEKASRPVSV